MKFGQLLSCSAVSLSLVAASAQSTSPVGASVPTRFLVSYRNSVIPEGAEASVERAGARLVQQHRALGISVVQATPATAAFVRQQLAADPSIQAVVEDRLLTAHTLQVTVAPTPTPAPATSTSDTYYSGPAGWAVRAVGGYGTVVAPGPWLITKGAGVRIAILDTGVDANHPDIAPNLIYNTSEVDQSAATGLPSPCDDGSPQDQQGHGSWTASLAAGAFGPQTGLVAGVAPSASLLNIKVLERLPSATTSAADPTGCIAGEASGLVSWLLKGIDDAVAQHADILSLSLGTLVDVTTPDGIALKSVFDQATHAAASAGAILIAAAGNDGLDLDGSHYLELPAQAQDVVTILASTNPACAENLTTGATCAAGPVTAPYYSNRGTSLNALAAPGGSYPAIADPAQTSGWVWGACSSGKPATLNGPPTDPGHSLGCFNVGHSAYVEAMGTSASAPLAAGAAALLRAANPSWSATEVVAALRQSTTVLSTLPAPLIDVANLLTPAASPAQHHIDNPNQR